VLMKMRIEEVPTTLDKDGRSRPPHLRPWRDGWRHLRFMFLYSPRWTFIYPGSALFLVGAVLLAALLPGRLQLGVVGLDVHTMLFASAALLLGFQLLAFGVAARTYASMEGLFPPDPAFQALRERFHLETGLLSGTALFLAGFGLASWTLLGWQQTGFGDLNVQQTLRPAILAVTFMALGAQLGFVSMLLSILGLQRRRKDAPIAAEHDATP